MKKIILSICTLVLISLFHISCNKEDIKPNKKEGTVEFGFSLKAPSHSGTQKSSMKAPAAEPVAIVVSIKKANGNSAYTMQKVDLYNMNGYYISKPLSLLPGSYTIEQFFVVDAEGNVMYATPLQGSPKAYLVSEPLPISFTVSKDAVTKIVPEVLSTEDSTPEDFGYSTFSFEVVKTFDFLIGVFVYNESTQNFELTNANLTIIAASKTIYTDTLAAITNKITINDGYDNYFLSITKDGYKTWSDTLTAAELKLYFRSEDKGPLEVILVKREDCNCQMGTVTDIDGNVYKTVKIGNQWWMAEDLRVTKYNDGSSIPTGLNSYEWTNTTKGAYALPYDNIDKYGLLYNWYTISDSRGLCPTGWHVPTDAEWSQLTDYLIVEFGYTNDQEDPNGVGNALKSCRQESSPLGDGCNTSEHPRWRKNDIHYGTDRFCFSALPGGNRYINGYGQTPGVTGYWWTATEYSTTHAIPRFIYDNYGYVGSAYFGFIKASGNNIRCVKD